MLGTKATLGETIDARGINFDLEDGDALIDVVVVAQVLTSDNRKYMAIRKDEHTNWLTEVGMLTIAHKMVTDEQD